MGKRKLPTYAWEPPGFENFDTIVVASNPSSPALKRHFAAGTEQALGIVALVALVAAAVSTPLMLHLSPSSDGAGWAGYAALAGAAVAALVWLGTALRLRSERHEHALEVIGAWNADSRRSRAAMVELVEDRRTLRDIARGPTGERVSDAVLFDVERVTWEAARAACAVDEANARKAAVRGAGREATALRDEIDAAAAFEAARVERYAAVVHEVAEAAAEMDAAFRRLQAVGLDPATIVDGTELYLVGELTDASRALRAQARAAREVCAAAGAPVLEDASR